MKARDSPLLCLVSCINSWERMGLKRECLVIERVIHCLLVSDLSLKESFIADQQHFSFSRCYSRCFLFSSSRHISQSVGVGLSSGGSLLNKTWVLKFHLNTVNKAGPPEHKALHFIDSFDNLRFIFHKNIRN